MTRRKKIWNSRPVRNQVTFSRHVLDGRHAELKRGDRRPKSKLIPSLTFEGTKVELKR